MGARVLAPMHGAQGPWWHSRTFWNHPPSMRTAAHSTEDEASLDNVRQVHRMIEIFPPGKRFNSGKSPLGDSEE